MNDESASPSRPAAGAASAPGLPAAVDRAAFQAELDALRVRETAHTREGDAITAARRLPMVEVDAATPCPSPCCGPPKSSAIADLPAAIAMAR